jgi:UrcA family protein
MNSKLNPRKLVAAGVAASVLAGFSFGSNAFAADADVPSVTVKYADLNLENQEGVASLFHRIRAAARRVCNGDENRDLGSMQIASRCVDDSTARAVAKVNVAGLSAYYQMETGHSVATLSSDFESGK